MHLRISPLLEVLPLFIHQCVSGTLPLQERQGGKTYWLHPSCNTGFLGNGKFKESIKEAIWAAGRISENLQAFDGQLSDPDTFGRIGKITETQDRKQAHIRILCNEDDDFKPVDGDGNTIPNPMGNSEIKITKYYNQEDDSYIMGADLCSMSTDAGITHEVALSNEKIGVAPDANGQDAERYIIRFCNIWIRALSEQNLPFTIRDYATRQLDNEIVELYKYGNIPIVTIIHELSHVHFLSGQEFTVPAGGDPGAEVEFDGYQTADEHGQNQRSGYYQDKDGDRQLMGSRGFDWQDTIMNADSYGWLALIFRLREKQWEAYTTGQGADEIIHFKKNTDLPDRGDAWPQ